MAQNRLHTFGQIMNWTDLRWMKWIKVGEREWVHCAVEGLGRPTQSRDRSAAQISSEADSSLTGTRRLPVNNRGSDVGHLAPWSAHFSSVILSLSLLPTVHNSHRVWGFFQWYFHQQSSDRTETKILSIWLNGCVKWKRGILLAPACFRWKKNIKTSKKMKGKQRSRLGDRWHHWFKLNICGPDTAPAPKADTVGRR